MQKRQMTLLVIAIVVTGVIAATLLTLAARGNEEGDNASVEIYSPFGLFGPGTLGALPTSASQTVLDSLGFESTTQYQEYSIDLAKELGISWVRIDFPYDGWTFIDRGLYIEELSKNGIEVVGCVLPINSFAPNDLAPFKKSMRDLIQRYPWIKIWQIGNEPDLAWDNPDDYPRFFFAIQQVIREDCPDCKIALAGAAARWPSQDVDGWYRSLGVYDRIIKEIARQSGNDTKPFDILDMHFYDFYGSEDAMLGNMKLYRELPRKYGLSNEIEFWVTECATTTGPLTWPDGAPDQTEEEQASELVTRFVTMLGAQVKRVAWARFYENYRYMDVEGGFFDNAGLIYNGLGHEADDGVPPGTKKLSFRAYRTLTSKLSGCWLVHKIDAGKYRFQLGDGREPVYVLWDAGGVDPPAELAGAVTVTDLEGNSTEMEGDQLKLGSVPVFVEKR